MNRDKHRLIAILAAIVMLAGAAVASPANASVTPLAFTTASGSKSCPSGQYVYVQVYTSPKGDVRYYQGSTLRRTAYGVNTDIYYYGVQSANWKVTTTTDFQSVGDGCSPTHG